MRSYTIMSSPSLLEYHLLSSRPIKWTTPQAFTNFTLSFPCAPRYADYSKFFFFGNHSALLKTYCAVLPETRLKAPVIHPGDENQRGIYPAYK